MFDGGQSITIIASVPAGGRCMRLITSDYHERVTPRGAFMEGDEPDSCTTPEEGRDPLTALGLSNVP